MSTTEDNSQVTFQYANECDLEIHCSPFGLSGLYIKIKGTNIMGIGSTMGLVTGSTSGLIHYNDAKDLMEQKYKLYVVVDEEGMLRIDFTKIFTLKQSDSTYAGGSGPVAGTVSSSSGAGSGVGSTTSREDGSGGNSGVPSIANGSEDSALVTPNATTNGGINSATPLSVKSSDQHGSPDVKQEFSPRIGDQTQGEGKFPEDEPPTLVFKGKCPEGRPDKIDPFIGIFSFERED